MKKHNHNHEFVGLLLITIIYAILCVLALFFNRPRVSLMIVLTCFMALMTFISRYRHRRKIQTLQGKGHRKEHAH